MESVIEKLAEIEAAAESIVAHAQDQKAEIDRQLQKERDEFDCDIERKTQEKLTKIRQESEEKMNAFLKEQREKNSSVIQYLKQDFEKNHAAYAGEILKNIIEV